MRPVPAAAEELHDRLRAAAAPLAGAGLRRLAALGRRDAALPEGLVPFLARHRAALAGWLEAALAAPEAEGGFGGDPAGHLAVRALRALQAEHQFAVAPDAAARLEQLHREALAALAAALRSAPDEAALAPAVARAADAYVAGLSDLARGIEAAGAGALRRVASAEYGPELQLEVLGLAPGRLLPPVLDLGCGAEGRLVRHLRALGVEATGVDRVADPAPGVRRGDWLAEPLAPGSLGTVISHLAFSLHFLHHHLRPGDAALAWARRYMEILRALRPGGTFAYVPGLPFVEAHLPAEAWRVERQPVQIAAPPGAAGVIPWYAARVTRVPDPRDG